MESSVYLYSLMWLKKFIFTILFLELLLVLIFVLTPSFAGAQNCPPGATCLKPPTEITSVQGLVVTAIQWILGLLATIAIVYTVVAGFRLIIATNEEAVKTAKESLTWAVGGFIVSLLAFTLVAGTAKLLGFISPSSTSKTLTPSVGTDDFLTLLKTALQNFLLLLGVATILMIIYHGYRYLTSAGNEEAIEGAKSGLKWAIAGFIVVILSYSIINLVNTYLLKL